MPFNRHWRNVSPKLGRFMRIRPVYNYLYIRIYCLCTSTRWLTRRENNRSAAHSFNPFRMRRRRVLCSIGNRVTVGGFPAALKLPSRNDYNSPTHSGARRLIIPADPFFASRQNTPFEYILAIEINITSNRRPRFRTTVSFRRRPVDRFARHTTHVSHTCSSAWPGWPATPPLKLAKHVPVSRRGKACTIGPYGFFRNVCLRSFRRQAGIEKRLFWPVISAVQAYRSVCATFLLVREL